MKIPENGKLFLRSTRHRIIQIRVTGNPGGPVHQYSSPWYGTGLKFKCTRCGACCRGKPGFVWVTVNEAHSISRHLGLPPADFFRQHLRTVHGRLSLLEGPDGDCEFFDSDSNGCQIYPLRPTQCRSYPFWPCITESRTSWGDESRSCPGINEDSLVPHSAIQAFHADWTSRLKS